MLDSRGRPNPGYFLALPVVLLASVFASTTLGEDGVSDEERVSDTAHPLPLPAHPDRVPPRPGQSGAGQARNREALPKAAQRDREQHRTVTRTSRKDTRLPIPGQPARGLPPVGKPNADEEEDEPESDDKGEEDAEEEENESDEETAPGLFLRLPHEVRDGGITAEYIYTGESYTLANGGMSQRQVTNYRGNLDFVLTLDSEKLGWWEGGRVFVYTNNVHGRPLSAQEVGDFQFFSNIDSTIRHDPATGEFERPRFTAVGEYWLEQNLLDNTIRLKVGKQDANADFAFTDLGGDFVHSSFGLPPTIPLPTWPSQALGVASFWKLTEDLTFASGVYDGTLSSGPQGARWGFDTLGKNGAISLFQLELLTQSGPQKQHPGTWRVGAWHHSDNSVWTEFSTGPAARTFAQNYGFWASVDRMLWKESYADDDQQGLSAFFQCSFAPQDRNAIRESYLAGVVYRGLVTGRDDDLFGAGLANVLFGSAFRDFTLADSGDVIGTHETAIEVFYKILFSQYFTLQPDLQFIASPSGQFQDALLPGFRFELIL